MTQEEKQISDYLDRELERAIATNTRKAGKKQRMVKILDALNVNPQQHRVANLFMPAMDFLGD